MMDLSIIRDLIAATREHLEEVETTLQLPEEGELDPGLIDAVSGPVHSIHENAQSGGTAGIAELAHSLENFIALHHRSGLPFNSTVLDTLQEGLDKISLLVDDLHIHGEEKTDTGGTLARIRLQEESLITEQKDDFPGRDINPPPTENPPHSTADISLLKDEIEAEIYDEELFDIFIKQLQENISQLRIWTMSFSDSPEKNPILNRCSELIFKLHSSANYMGYDRLADFYGQWIAELEMAGMEISTGNPVSLDFMERYIRIITELFPRIEEPPGEFDTEEEPAEKEDLEEAPLFSDADAVASSAVFAEDESESLSYLFSSFDDAEDDYFPDDSSIIAALSDEDPDQEITEVQAPSFSHDEPLPELEQKLDHFFSDPKEAGTKPVADEEKNIRKKRTFRHAHLMIDIDSLKEEIGSEEYDEELFFIFRQQLQENISRLRTMTDNLPDASNKSSIINACSDLVTALHSSANYMGYERLTEFYGQWIAELEMTDLRLTTGDPVSLDFMAANINTIDAIFPPHEDVLADEPQDQSSRPETDDAPGLSPIDDLPAPDASEPFAAVSAANHQIKEDEEISPDDDEYDQLEAAFADADEIEEDLSFEEPFEQDADLTGNTEARRKELFARLSGVIESLSTVSGETDDFQPKEQDADILPRPEDENHEQTDADRKLFDRLSMALDAEEHLAGQEDIGATIEEENDRQLYNMLSSALDEKGFDRRAARRKSIDDVLQEILTGEGFKQTEAEQSPHAGARLDTAFMGYTDDLPSMQRTVEADRRLNLSDRRRGPEDRRLLDPLMPPQTRRSIRVDADKIDHLMNRAGELAASRSEISQLHAAIEKMRKEPGKSSGSEEEALTSLHLFAGEISRANAALDRVSREIREGIQHVRMIPVDHIFKRYQSIVRDTARQGNKKIRFTVRGEETKLDKIILEELSEQLVHLLRNSIQHGIEAPAERKKAGKDETGSLLLEACTESNAVVIRISDDGRGIDSVKIAEKAMRSGLVSAEEIETMDQAEIIRLIMAPGFSNSSRKAVKSVPETGLKIIRNNIENLNGTIDISSRVGGGTTTRIKIPLSVSVIQSLGISLDSRILVVPLANVVETIRIRKEEISCTGSLELIQHRDAALPVFKLAEILNIPGGETESTHFYILIVQANGMRAGLIVDGFMRPRETIIKPLAEYLRTESGFSGATILDDGTISLVLDIAVLLDIIKNRTTGEEETTLLENSLLGLAVPEVAETAGKG